MHDTFNMVWSISRLGVLLNFDISNELQSAKQVKAQSECKDPERLYLWLIANLARSSDTISMPKVQTYGRAARKARIIKFVQTHTPSHSHTYTPTYLVLVYMCSGSLLILSLSISSILPIHSAFHSCGLARAAP